MAQYCVTRQVVWPCVIMLLLGCFCLFVAFGAVDLTPQRQRQTPPDQSKEILLVNVVRLIASNNFFCSMKSTDKSIVINSLMSLRLSLNRTCQRFM